MRAASFGLGAVAITGAATAAAAGESTAPDGAETIHLDYVASDGCPSGTEFESRVVARTARAHFAPDDGERRVLEVRVVAGPPARGRVTVRRAGSVEGTREVRADTCADVADALALVVALAIDPNALMAPAAPAPTAPVASAAPPPATPVASPTPETPPPPAPATATGPPAATLLPHPTEASPIPVRAVPRTTFSLGAALGVSSGTAPTTLFGVSPRLGWQSPADSPVVASVRLGFLHATTGELALLGGSAIFALTVGQLDGCAVGWPRNPARLSVCARVESGVIDATGSQVVAPQSQTRGWLDVGPVVHGEWSVLAPMFIEAELGASFHVTADRFYFRPDTTAYQVPTLGLCASAGVGVFFF